MILSTKAREISDVLVKAGLVKEKDRMVAYSVILDEMRTGGSYALMESGASIQVKTIVRNKKGDVVAVQG